LGPRVVADPKRRPRKGETRSVNTAWVRGKKGREGKGTGNDEKRLDIIERGEKKREMSSRGSSLGLGGGPVEVLDGQPSKELEKQGDEGGIPIRGGKDKPDRKLHGHKVLKLSI